MAWETETSVLDKDRNTEGQDRVAGGVSPDTWGGDGLLPSGPPNRAQVQLGGAPRAAPETGAGGPV